MDASPELCSPVEDIQYLLYIESLKRYMDLTKNIKRQVNEHARVNSDIKFDYLREYERLANLMKQVNLCTVLEAQSPQDGKLLEDMLHKLTAVSAKIANDKLYAEIDGPTLNEFKAQLGNKHRPRTQLTKHESDVAENCKTIRAVRTTLEHVESGVDIATSLTLDQLANELQPPQK
ncbi:augmin complex subunit dgt4 [Drosophila busckii]|uniref:augmin complex subunit dgt4 n=1 Tax=Drosophila busckii TaxID=30019 RepID=UPI00083F3556|nr:augmin complex subunit dgt4 [Drosophila busckii]